MAGNRLRLALVQLTVGSSKIDNVQNAVKYIKEAASNGANIVSLPECCNCPYGNSFFPEYAEPIPGPTAETFAKAAADNNVFLVAGSIPEKDHTGKLFNTSMIFSPDGNMIGKHRKIHLFDIDIPGKITFQESKTLTPGDKFTTFDTPYCKVGVGICYDIRFPEMAQIYRKRGCDLLIYPGAFNMTTGPAHWEKLQIARALDNQLYVATISPARDEEGPYTAWGHSTCVNPWGEIVCKAGHSEEIAYADLDLDFVKQVREQIPISKQTRDDLYGVEDKQSS